MGELSVTAIDLAPRLSELHDGLDLPVEQTMDRVPARGQVVEPVFGAALKPAVDAEVIDLQHRAGAPLGPALLDGIIDELEQAGLDVALDSRGDQTGQSQRPFPRSSMSSQACSLIVSVSRVISALAAFRSYSTCLLYTSL